MAVRVIKFRVWDKTDRLMYDIDFYWFEEQMVRTVDDLRGQYVLLQSTGMLDKHGTEIYEGDIVVRDGYLWFDNGVPSYRDTVEWIYSMWQVVHHCVNPDKRGISDGINVGLNDDGVDEGGRTNWEVLGNIYEHPALITGLREGE